MDRRLMVVELDHGTDFDALRNQLDALPDTVVKVGTSAAQLPNSAEQALEAFTFTLAPGGPGRTVVETTADRLRAELDDVARAIDSAPGAAATLCSLLKGAANLAVRDSLVMESLAYSMLLAGPEHQEWLAQAPDRKLAIDEPGTVILEREGPVLTVALNRPERRNAFGRWMRDQFIDALELPRLDPSIEVVHVRGNGPSFCSGGDLAEFGTAEDPVSAHLIRVERSAGLAIYDLATRVRVRVHGACIGAGVELPAFAAYVSAAPDSYFRLPELAMGLIPGAGGTVSLTKRIGRWRTAYMGLTGNAVDAQSALSWGLIDEVR